MNNRIALARQQGVDVHTRFLGDLLKRAALQLVRDKYAALLFGKILDRGLQLIEQHSTRVSGLRSSVRRRQQIFQQERLILTCPATKLVASAAPLFAKPIDNAVSRDAVKPRAN